MNGKVTKVLLVVPADNIQREFNMDHAERILQMPNNGGWQLPSNSQFEFSKEYGLKYRRNKKEDKR